MTTGGGVRAAFSPDGGTLAVASTDGRLKTFDTGKFFSVWRDLEGEKREKKPAAAAAACVFFFLVVVVQRPLALSCSLPLARDKAPLVPRCLFLSAQLQEETT